MALSWLNLTCALKAGIGIGNRTLGSPRQSAARRGPRQGLLRVRRSRYRRAHSGLIPGFALEAQEVNIQGGKSVRPTRKPKLLSRLIVELP